MDEHEVAVAIYAVQNKLLGQPTYQKYKGGAGAEKK
jgi:hypothetical protein